MAFDTGGGGGLNSSINVTPMIDVLLVLLIVFMVIVPVTPKGLDRWFRSRRRTHKSSRTTTAPSWSRSLIAQAGVFPATRSTSWMSPTAIS